MATKDDTTKTDAAKDDTGKVDPGKEAQANEECKDVENNQSPVDPETGADTRYRDTSNVNTPNVTGANQGTVMQDGTNKATVTDQQTDETKDKHAGLVRAVNELEQVLSAVRSFTVDEMNLVTNKLAQLRGHVNNIMGTETTQNLARPNSDAYFHETAK